MSNMGLFKAMKRDGIEVCVTTVGDKYVNEAMVANGYVLGGEQSGHIIFSKHATIGDGILYGIDADGGDPGEEAEPRHAVPGGCRCTRSF